MCTLCEGFPIFIYLPAPRIYWGRAPHVQLALPKWRILKWTSVRHFTRRLENPFCIFHSFIVCRGGISLKKIMFSIVRLLRRKNLLNSIINSFLSLLGILRNLLFHYLIYCTDDYTRISFSNVEILRRKTELSETMWD